MFPDLAVGFGCQCLVWVPGSPSPGRLRLRWRLPWTSATDTSMLLLSMEMKSRSGKESVSLEWRERCTKHHPEDVEAACRKTLQDLGLQYLDLYLIHWPMAFKRGDDPFPLDSEGNMVFDETIDPTDVWLTMERLVSKGLARSIGVSNFNQTQIEDILQRGTIRPAVNQIERHPYLSMSSLTSYCQAQDIVVTAYSPLGSPGTLGLKLLTLFHISNISIILSTISQATGPCR